MLNLYDIGYYDLASYDTYYSLNPDQTIPINCRIDVNYGNALSIRWDPPIDPSSVIGYRVYRAYTDIQNFEVLYETTDPTILNYIDTGVQKSYKYYYRVSSLLNQYMPVNSTYSPQNLQVFADYKSLTSLLTWSVNQTGILNYNIYRADNFSDPMKMIGTTTDMQYIDSGLDPTIMYYYRISSVY